MNTTIIRRLYRQIIEKYPDIIRVISQHNLNASGIGSARGLMGKVELSEVLVFTPLIQAILLRIPRLVELLLLLDADANLPFECEYPYTYAVFSCLTSESQKEVDKSIKIINLLLKKNLIFDNMEANHPLSSLIGCKQSLMFVDHLPVVAGILTNKYDGSPFHMLAKSVVKPFTVLGKSLPFDWLSEAEFSELFEVLTKVFEVDIDYKDQSGFSAYYLALNNKNDIMVKALYQWGADTSLPSIVRRKPMVEELIAREQKYIK